MNVIRLRYGLFFLALYLLFLIVTLPAAQVYRWSVGEGGAQLYGIDGTLWRGQAQTMRIGALSLDKPAWTFRPGALLLGRTEFRVSAGLGGGGVQAVTGRSLRGALYARDLQLSAVPIDTLAALGGEPDLGLTGRIDASIDALGVSGGQLRELAGRVEANGLGMGPPLDIALGGLTLQFETDRREDRIRGVLQDTGGPLQAEGSLVLQPTGEYQFVGRVSARGAAAGKLGQTLNMLGRPGPDGRIAINRNGSIPLDRYLPQ